MSTDLKKGIVLAFIAALISGVANFTNKYAVGSITPPLVFTTVKNLGVGLLIIAVVLATKRWRLIKNLTRKEIFYLVLIGIVGGSIPFYLYFTGLASIPAINAALIHKTLIVWVAILAAPFLKEKLSKKQTLALLLVFFGNLIIGGFKGFRFSTGEGLVLVATIFWAIENVLAKKVLPKVDADIVTVARMGIGSIILLVAAVITAPAALGKTLQLNQTQIFWLFTSVVTLLGYVMCWYRSLKYAPAVTVTTILVVATLVTNILSAIFVTHSLDLSLIIQFVVVAFGIGFFVESLKELPLPKQALKLNI